jgi:hypothetical protein
MRHAGPDRVRFLVEGGPRSSRGWPGRSRPSLNLDAIRPVVVAVVAREPDVVLVAAAAL